MAKVKVPLGSFSASGAIAKTLSFRKALGRHIVSRFHKPNDYRKKDPSVSQLTQRALYSAGVVAWNVLSQNEKDDYAIDALPKHLTGFNLFMKEYLLTPIVTTFRLLETGDIRLLETGDILLLE